jgi:hypothetical protein
MSSNSLISLGDLSKPATALIEKVSEAVGGICKPWQIVRVAKAEAEAERMHAESQIQISDLQRRAMHRFLVEEGKKQANIEEITAKALPHLSEESKPQEIETDWITSFFDKSRIISDEQMQELWARVLAGEANVPGSFSRRTVNLLSDLEKRDAELFRTLCGLAWMIGDLTPLVFDLDGEIYEKLGLSFEAFSHLESLGLIQLGTVGGFNRARLAKQFVVFYYGTPVRLTFSGEKNNTLEVGRTLFTKAGREIAVICGSTPVDGYFDFVCSRWEKQQLVVEKISAP